MKKLISLLLCFTVVFSMMTILTVNADESDFNYFAYYGMEETANAKVESSGSWSDSSGTTTLENGLVFNPHHTSDETATATFTINNIPAGSYAVEYFINHSSTYATFKMDLNYDDNTESIDWPWPTTGWCPVKVIELTGGAFSLTVGFPEGITSSQNIRATAVRLIPYIETTEYIIRHTKTNGTASSYGTFETSGTWTDSKNSYNLEGISHTQLISNASGAYAQYNFVKTETPIPLFNTNNYTGIKAGYYDVYYYIPQQYREDDPAASVSVFHNDTFSNYTFDFTKLPQLTWLPVNDPDDPLYFTGDGSEYLRVTQVTSGKYIRAGAVKLVKRDMPDEEPDVEIKDLISSPDYSNGTLTVVTNGLSVETDTKTVYALVASYTDGDKLLAGVKTTPITITKNAEDTTVTVDLPVEPGTSYKLFILDNLTSVKPIISNFNF